MDEAAAAAGLATDAALAAAAAGEFGKSNANLFVSWNGLAMDACVCGLVSNWMALPSIPTSDMAAEEGRSGGAR